MDAGYKVVAVDDCWMKSERDDEGHLVADEERFDGGISDLSESIVSQGFKFGLFATAGEKTCKGGAGSLDNEAIDAADFKNWHVDYLKYDNCHNKFRSPQERFSAMQRALNETEKRVFFAVCNRGRDQVAQWAPQLANSWRTTHDNTGTWESIEAHFKENMELREQAAAGAWNDLDVLAIGNSNLTLEE